MKKGHKHSVNRLSKGAIQIMEQIKFMIRHFLKEPLWFKILIIVSLVISIVFSSTLFSTQPYFQSSSKLAAAFFFSAYGINMRKNVKISGLFFILAGLCLFLSIKTVY